MKELPIRSLSKGEKRRLQRGETGTLAEELLAYEYGLEHRPDEADWYDAVHPNSGAKTEVKSCLSKVGDEYPAEGRFRLRADQMRSLIASDARGVAWYGFVLFDLDDGLVRMRRAKPSTVSRWVRERGGWNEAGHEEFERQRKIPHWFVFH